MPKRVPKRLAPQLIASVVSTPAELGMRLRRMRQQRRWSRAYLAYMTGLSADSIENWEGGTNYPQFESLVRLADAFDVSCDALMRGVPTERDPFGQAPQTETGTLIYAQMKVDSIRRKK